LVQQKSRGNDQYPKTISDANNVLNNYRFDAATNKQNAKGTHQESTKDKEGDELPNLLLLKWKGNVTDRPKQEWAIKERVRACSHYLPYVHLSRRLIKYLVLECTEKLNYFPGKNGVSKYYSH